MKLFTKEIDQKLFAQYSKGSDLSNQMVVAKIFNPYGRGTWYLINSDVDDPDYLWAIVDLFEVEVGSVSRKELESIKIKPFNLGLERDLSFTPRNAEEVFKGLLSGKTYAKGGITARGLGKINDKVFDKHDFQSGSEIKSSKANKIKYAQAADDFLKQAGVEKGSLSKGIYLKLEDENLHTLNEFLVLNDYFEPGVKSDKQSYLKRAKEQPDFYLGADGIIGGKSIVTKVPSKSSKLKYDPSRDVVAIAIKDGVFNKMFIKGDFLGGAYQMESGGVLKDYNYVSPRNIIFARLKSGEDIKPVNGFYIRKNASGTVMTDAASKPIAKANVKSLKISIPRPILLTGSPSKSPQMMKFIGTFSGKDLLRPAMTFVQIKEGSIVATDANKLIRIIDGSTLNEDKLVCEAAKCKTEKPEDQKFPSVSFVLKSIDSEFSESYDMVDLYESLMQVRNDDLKNKLSRTLRVIELKLENETIYFNITLLLQCVKGCLLLGWKKAFISYTSADIKPIVFTEEKAEGRVGEVSLILLMPILSDSATEKVTITPKMILEQGGMMANGGEVVIPTTYLDYNPDYLVGTNTMYEMFADGGMMVKGGKIREFDDVLIISKNKLGMVEAIANNIYYITTPFGESFEAALDDLQKVKSFAQGGAMEHRIYSGDSIKVIYDNRLIVEDSNGDIMVIDLSTEPQATRYNIQRITNENTIESAKEFIESIKISKPVTTKGLYDFLTYSLDDDLRNGLNRNTMVVSKGPKWTDKKFLSLARYSLIRGGFILTFFNDDENDSINFGELISILKEYKDSELPIIAQVPGDFPRKFVRNAGYDKLLKEFFIEVAGEYRPPKFAKGGSLNGHGLEIGDLIVEDLGSSIMVLSEDGKTFYIDLREGERYTEQPLPFKHGGRVKHSDVTRLATKTNEAGDEVVDLTEFYEGGGNVPKVFDVPAQFLDAEGKRKNDKKTIKELTDFVLELPQTKEIYYNDELGDYTPSRKKLHAEIINKFKKEVVCINNDKPIAIFMGGSPASGKSSFLRKYSPFLLKEEILKIDADEIRAMLPEYEGWNACQTHLETKDIVNILLSNKNIGIPCDFDIIYDGTMNSVKSYIPLMDILRKRGYKIFIVFMDNVPKDVIIKRALDRYKKSGRFVPLEVIEDFFSKGKTAFNELKKDVDGYMLIDGSSEDYKVLEEGGMKLPRDREYSKLGTKIKASEIPVSYKKGGLSKLY